MILLFSAALAAGEAEFAGANAALAGGDLAAAEAGYRAALGAGAIDADVYYDLGNVLYREGQTARAVLAWRRALALSPRDPDALANLEFARRSLRDDVATADPHPAWAPWQAALTPAEAQWLGGALAGVGLLALALRRRAPAAPLAGLGAAAALVGVGVGLGGLQEGGMPAGAVVLAPEVTAQSDLGGGVALFTLHAGAELQVHEVAAGQVLVGLGDGRKGWLPEADVGRIDPHAPFP